MFRKMIAALALGVLPLPVMAQENQCGDDARRIVEAAYPAVSPMSDVKYVVDGRELTVPLDEYLRIDPHVMVCRHWPAYPDRMLVAVPLMQPSPSASAEVVEGDLDLLVLNAESLEVEARLRLDGFIEEDAIYLAGIWFDTAPYRLIGDRIAFGLRREMTGSSRPNPFDLTGLWLFDVEGGKIRPILEGLQVELSRGEWDTDCAGEFEQSESVLDVAPTTQNGAADIILRQTMTTTINARDGGECKGTDTLHDVPPVTLRYDGQRYPVPDELLDLYVKG